jgi:hypothetical protein
MPHTIESATTGRSKCRACGTAIPKGELRFGERLPNPFGDEGSETTHWYHVLCGAYRRPESFAELLESDARMLDNYDELASAVSLGLAYRRVERINTTERAPSGRARCRHCREAIGKGDWRIGLVFFEEGVTNPAGFIHVSCAAGYFDTVEILDRLQHFGAELDADEVTEIGRLLSQ